MYLSGARRGSDRTPRLARCRRPLQLTFMDSSGLGAIHAARRIAIKDGGNLVVCRPSPLVYRVLEITGLDVWVTDWNPKWSNGPAMECI